MQVGYEQNCYFRPISSLRQVFSTLQPSHVVNRSSDCHWLMTLIADSTKRRRLLIVGDGWRSATHQWILFMTGSLDIIPKITEHNLIVHIGKSEAEVTTVITKGCIWGIVMLKLYWQIRSIARPLCDGRACCCISVECVGFLIWLCMHCFKNEACVFMDARSA